MLNMDSPIPITRDLDIVVTSPSKKVFIGDHLPNGDTQHFSTNEKVIIRNNELEDGDYVIHIYGGYFADSKISDSSLKQEFSVVASGPIKNSYLEFNDISSLKQEFSVVENAFYVSPSEIKRIRFISPKNIKYVFSKSRNPGHDSTLNIVKNCMNSRRTFGGKTFLNGYNIFSIQESLINLMKSSLNMEEFHIYYDIIY